MTDTEMTGLRTRVLASLERIRPYLQSDGGDIELVNITDDHIVQVRLTGACNGCPFSMQTLKAGVELALLKEVPEIKEVVAL